jgi:hypothetical protein
MLLLAENASQPLLLYVQPFLLSCPAVSSLLLADKPLLLAVQPLLLADQLLLLSLKPLKSCLAYCMDRDHKDPTQENYVRICVLPSSTRFWIRHHGKAMNTIPNPSHKLSCQHIKLHLH